MTYSTYKDIFLNKLNLQIKSKNVRLINELGEALGIVKIEEALEIANQASLDLVQIASNTDPVVCKILNYGKYRYDKEKQKKINKKKQHVMHVKEIRFRPNVDDHDLIIKLKKAEKFLSKYGYGTKHCPFKNDRPEV